MKPICTVWAATSMAAMLACGGAPAVTATDGTQFPNTEVVRLDQGVYAAVRREPLGLAVNANSLLLVRDTDVVVVDAQFTRAATRETIAALRTITDKPVRYVITTHWHDDHVAGNQVYRDSFPGVRFVMHANTAADLVAVGAPNRTATVEGAPPLADRYERLLGMGLGIDSTPASPAESASVTSAIRIIRAYIAEDSGYRAIPADDTVQRRLTLGTGRDRVDVVWFGLGNTRGDLVVHLPDKGIVATGDLIVAPIPFAFGSNPADWVGALDSIAALGPRILLPGHGPVMRDVTYLRTVRDALERIRDETAQAVARGDSVDVILDTVTLDDLRLRLTGDAKWLNYMFRSFFVRPAVRRAHEQARAPGPTPTPP
jgi:glyoxylase-like metal-dependent hydrolase (beta-lactamase superfamily II)